MGNHRTNQQYPTTYSSHDFACSQKLVLEPPLALTLMFGLASSTVLVLYVIPALYLLFGGKDQSVC